MTRRAAFLSLLFCAVVAASAFGHAGEVHSYMGTLTDAGSNGTFTMKTTKGENVSFVTARTTVYRFADNSPAGPGDLAVGSRVVVDIAKDGKTATKIKIAARSK